MFTKRQKNNIMDKFTTIDKLKGVGDKTALLFNKIGVCNADDLLHYYPRRYDVYEHISLIKDASTDERNAILASVKSVPKVLRFNGKSVVSFFVTDGENSCEVRFYNAPYLAKTIKLNDRKVFRGYLKLFKDKLYLEQPKMYDPFEYSRLEGCVTPVYNLTKDLSNERIKKCVSQVLEGLSVSDYLTPDELNSMNMLSNEDAFKGIHFPENFDVLYKARRRIVFDEFVSFIGMSKEASENAVDIPNNYKMIETADLKHLEDSLPYSLTRAQKAAVNDVVNDMQGDAPMNRLIQGDVGSGKTIVSVMAMLMTVCNNYQCCMMAPTEVLARQHFNTIKSLTKKYKLPFKPVLLTGKMTKKERETSLKMISDGEANVILGTHAVFQDAVTYNNLALVITDEQHRFGVNQRETLKDKGKEPHLLVMSATPIPRTLAMIIFAGLSISVIDEMPKNRIPISNCVVNSSFRAKAYEKIRSEIDKGHQAYVICPMVYDDDESELNLHSVETHSKELKEYFGEKYRIGSLTGKMKPDEKTKIMESFADGNIDILVSTTVIEVGIDVANATVIMIEDAERFGLSQLHQLRGRVGRGNYESFCILVSDSKNEATQKRLKILNETNDGFKIANEDMKLRGPGELNGVRQSGELSFGIGDMIEDSDILMLASSMYDKLKSRLPSDLRKQIDFRTI